MGSVLVLGFEDSEYVAMAWVGELGREDPRAPGDLVGVFIVAVVVVGSGRARGEGWWCVVRALLGFVTAAAEGGREEDVEPGAVGKGGEEEGDHLGEVGGRGRAEMDFGWWHCGWTLLGWCFS